MGLLLHSSWESWAQSPAVLAPEGVSTHVFGTTWPGHPEQVLNLTAQGEESQMLIEEPGERAQAEAGGALTLGRAQECCSGVSGLSQHETRASARGWAGKFGSVK